MTPQPHRVQQRTRTPRAQRTKMGLTHVFGCVHTEVRVHHHDHGWVPTCVQMSRDNDIAVSNVTLQGLAPPLRHGDESCNRETALATRLMRYECGAAARICPPHF